LRSAERTVSVLGVQEPGHHGDPTSPSSHDPVTAYVTHRNISDLPPLRMEPAPESAALPEVTDPPAAPVCPRQGTRFAAWGSRPSRRSSMSPASTQHGPELLDRRDLRRSRPHGLRPGSAEETTIDRHARNGGTESRRLYRSLRRQAQDRSESVTRRSSVKAVEAYRTRITYCSGRTGAPTRPTVGAYSAFLAAFLVVPAPTERSLGDPAGKLAHR
jgi:hypothetical protein